MKLIVEFNKGGDLQFLSDPLLFKCAQFECCYSTDSQYFVLGLYKALLRVEQDYNKSDGY